MADEKKPKKHAVDGDLEASRAYQLEIAARLQRKVLEVLEAKLDDGTISGPEMSTLVKLLSQNGWAIDPAKVPEGLRQKLTSVIDPNDLNDDDPDVPQVN